MIDPSLLEGLTEDQKKEAYAAAAAAKRAEERAEQRALERAMEKKRLERLREKEASSKSIGKLSMGYGGSGAKRGRLVGASNGGTDNGTSGGVKFISKRQRQQKQQEEQQQQRQRDGNETKTMETKEQRRAAISTRPSSRPAASRTSNSAGVVVWTDHDRKAVRETYLGGSKKVNMTDEEFAERKRLQKKKNAKTTKSGKKTNFRFEWDDTDDTLRTDDPLYNGPSLVGGGGKFKGASRSSQSGYSRSRLHNRKNRNSFHNGPSDYDNIETKPLEKMTSRDWRIFRENHNIVCKGGKAPPPLRSFRDGNLLHPSLLRALFQNMGYKEPTPIQRQAIPIGLQRRDLIGIAETGSGKTAAFGIPLVQYLLQLPAEITSIERVAEQGPLAMVLAPTRELALQIDGEFQKLMRYSFSNQGANKKSKILCCPIVGGQNMTAQAQRLREGVHVIVGTPGRINECLEMAYMVLNQCLYTVLDEGDRMIDMGFAPQLESILDHMGGSLKSENEKEAYEQEQADLEQLKTLAAASGGDNTGRSNFELPKHRVTAMFSATMPAEVEHMAKRYLRHPAVVSVGDKDSRNNARIVQKIIYLSSPSQKEEALRKLVLDPRFLREKVIVFVNEKKYADGVGRTIERFGRRCVVLHGGKSQDERERNLSVFKQGGVVLVATDVAGRGLDISNIAHVINYDLPSRNIDSYAHRIGRTGRAGKDGLATSLLTDEDEGIMALLRAYLESTGSVVPDKLARNPASQSGTSSEKYLIY